ncbi:hypothetical protein P170DRAFT_192849 [Aspergillus steynii IBT 23096]|uniref:MARVEL domain-containing protein n=1 Tax=Aspergillus steynii IBT 23096 TaxID=1392250 RepID=A0A2I2GAE0_9EURO|nr:uncharacterized protein P170DRAFT_192849 [Aspergillus steynii IBT 23096]PLB49833.1 hypothetical protein P170DRAFT_192849 [Aspergillus steynii IBT 23096]
MQLSKEFSQDGHPVILALRISAVLSALIALIVFAWAVKAHETVFSDVNGSSLCLIVLITVAYAFVWSTVALIVRLVFNRPLHAGIYIALDLLGFGAVVGSTIAMLVALEPYGMDYQCVKDPCATNVGQVQAFGAAMSLLDGALHLTLFVWACWACRSTKTQGRKTVDA